MADQIETAVRQPRSLDEWQALNPLRVWRLSRQPQPRGWSLEDVATCTGTTRTSVLYWEQGQYWPRPSCMQALADMMAISMPTLQAQWAGWMESRPATKHAGVGITKRLRAATRHRQEKKQQKRAAKKAA